MRTADLGFRVAVVRGVQFLEGRAVDKIIDLGRQTVTLTDFGDPERLAVDAFNAGAIAAQAIADPSLENDEVAYINDDGVCLAGVESRRNRPARRL